MLENKAWTGLCGCASCFVSTWVNWEARFRLRTGSDRKVPKKQQGLISPRTWHRNVSTSCPSKSKRMRCWEMPHLCNMTEHFPWCLFPELWLKECQSQPQDCSSTCLLPPPLVGAGQGCRGGMCSPQRRKQRFRKLGPTTPFILWNSVGALWPLWRCAQVPGFPLCLHSPQKNTEERKLWSIVTSQTTAQTPAENLCPNICSEQQNTDFSFNLEAKWACLGHSV